jgi:hypothetical protein
MAVTITEPIAETTSTSNVSSYAMSAFTPTANALLVCYVVASGTVAAAPTMTGGGLTWIRRARQVFNTTDIICVFTAQVGGSPASTTPTFDCTGDAATGCAMALFSATGHNTTFPVAQVVTEARTAADPTVTRAAADTDNAYIAGFGIARSAPSATEPSGWTEIADTGYSTPNTGIAAAYRSGGETSTSVTFTAASAAYGIAYIEIRDAAAALPGVATLLGARLLRLNGSYAAGAHTCVLGTGNAIQATAANQPAVFTTTGGVTCGDYDGAAPNNHDNTVQPAIPTAPTYNSSHHRLIGLILRADSLPEGSIGHIISWNSGGGLNDDCLWIGNAAGANHLYMGTTARTNAAITDGNLCRIIVVRNGTTGVCTIYRDGVAQTTTASSHTMGTNWALNGPTYGTQPVSTTRRFDGVLGYLLFAHDASTAFSADDIADLDALLLEAIDGADAGAIAGTSDGTCTVTGTLTGAGALSGAASGASTDTGTLTGAGALSGSASGTCTVDGSGFAFMAASGSSDGTCTVGGTLLGSGALSATDAGTCTVAGTLLGAGALSGTSDGTCTVSGSLVCLVSGTSDGACTASATLAGVGALSGSASGSSTVDGTATGVGSLTGTIAAFALAAATLLGVGALSGTSAGASTDTGTLTGAGALSGSASGTCTVDGTLVNDSPGEGDISGTSVGTSVATGTLTGAGALSGLSDGACTVAGTLVGAGALVGSSDGTCTVSGSLVCLVSGTSVGTCTVAGTLTGAGALRGSSEGTCTVSGAGFLTGDLAGTSVGTCTATATLAGAGALSGSAAGTCTVAGTFSIPGALVGSAAGTCTVVGTLTDGTVRAVVTFTTRPAVRILYSSAPPIRIDVAGTRPAVKVLFSMADEKLYVGATNDIDFECRDGHTADLFDPVPLKVRTQRRATETAPAGPLVEYTYGVGSVITRQSLGKYRAAILCTEAGIVDVAILPAGGAKPFSFPVYATI